MGSPDCTSSPKQDIDEDVAMNIDSSNKSTKPGSGEDADGLDHSARKRSATDRYESRKRVAGSSRADCNQDGYEATKEFSKQLKKKIEVNALEKMSSW
ncbi:methyltransferase 1 [Olea europaea subsp. europaea]|uniref:Methyltransferase 1 n=1 Tax=Olea europaea subsp. europaea TaxID=158383 RepID=A0A8S0Q983_OLEEU|nr:methyltransferase 1 [Olea europaea subsp. europaea]